MRDVGFRARLGAGLMFFLLLAVGTARADVRGIPIAPGDSATSAIDPAGDTDTYVIDLFEGTRLNLVVKAGKGSDLEPAIEVLGPDGLPMDLAGRLKQKGRVAKVRGLVAESTGRHAIRVSGAGDSSGAYQLKTAGKLASRVKIRALELPAGETRTVRFPGLSDSVAKITLKARGEFEVISVLRPGGGEVAGAAGQFAARGRSVRGTVVLPGGFGDYALVLGNAPAANSIRVTARIMHPKVPRRKREISSLEPVITGLDPETGRGGQTITIVGSNFQAGTPVVLFDESLSPLAERISGTRISARVPFGVPGLVDITVYNPDGQDATRADAFEYIPEPPTVSTISPVEGPDDGGTTVTALGSRLDYVSRVQVGGLDLSAAPEAIGPDRLRFVTDPHPPGTALVTFVDPWGQGTSLPAAFTFHAPPNPTATVPARVGESGGTTVAVLGDSFHPDARVFVDGVAVSNLEYLGPGRLEFPAPAHAAGAAELRVTDPWDRSVTLPGGLEYVEPRPANGSFTDVSEDRMPANTSFDSGNTTFATDFTGDRIRLGDLDGDQALDMVLGPVAYTVDSGSYQYKARYPAWLYGVKKGEFNYGYYRFPPDYLPADDFALGDLDGDGDLDLVVTMDQVYTYYYSYRYYGTYYYSLYNVPYSSTRVFLNDGDGYFTKANGAFPDPSLSKGTDLLQGKRVELGDVDGDQDLDVVVSRDRNVGTSDWTMTGYTYYYYGTKYYYAYVYFSTKYNANTPATRVLLNDGTGRFTNATAAALPAPSAGDLFAAEAMLLGDLDGDGDLDLVVAGDSELLRTGSSPEYVSGSKTRLLRNDGSGRFANVTATALPAPGEGDDHGATAIALGDLDGDGRSELAISVDHELSKGSGSEQTFLPSTRIFRGRSDGTFAARTRDFLPAVRDDGQGEMWRAADLAIGDPDQAGYPDLFLGSRSPVYVLDEGSGKFDRRRSSLRWLQNRGVLPLFDSTERGLPSPGATGDFYETDAVLLGDVDGDGDLDLVITTTLPAFQGEGKRPSRLLDFDGK